jgi:glyoxylase-like metal-dependent hydrolase (beta-lactamase superfamily II)
LRIHAIQTGTVRVKLSQPTGSQGEGLQRLWRTLRDPEWTDQLPIYAWAIEHPEGLVVVDTGETSRAAHNGYFPAWHPYYRLGVRIELTPEQEIGPRLLALNLNPRQVRWLVMTHLHTDHAGGLAYFRDSEILISRAEYQAAQGFGGLLLGYVNQHWPAWLQPELVDYPDGPLGPFPASRTLTRAGDLHLVPTPGHSPGHQCVVLQDSGTTYLFAGDVSYSRELLQAGAVDGVTQDIPAYKQSLERTRQFVETERAVYLPSHDPQSGERLAKALAGLVK